MTNVRPKKIDPVDSKAPVCTQFGAGGIGVQYYLLLCCGAGGRVSGLWAAGVEVLSTDITCPVAA